MELQHILVKGVTCRCKISCERRLIVFVLRIMIYLFVDTTRKPDYYTRRIGQTHAASSLERGGGIPNSVRCAL